MLGPGPDRPVHLRHGQLVPDRLPDRRLRPERRSGSRKPGPYVARRYCHVSSSLHLFQLIADILQICGLDIHQRDLSRHENERRTSTLPIHPRSPRIRPNDTGLSDLHPPEEDGETGTDYSFIASKYPFFVSVLSFFSSFVNDFPGSICKRGVGIALPAGACICLSAWSRRPVRIPVP